MNTGSGEYPQPTHDQTRRTWEPGAGTEAGATAIARGLCKMRLQTREQLTLAGGGGNADCQEATQSARDSKAFLCAVHTCVPVLAVSHTHVVLQCQLPPDDTWVRQALG